MNVQEGARRMRHVGVWLALIGVCGSALHLVFLISQMFRPVIGVQTQFVASGLLFMGGLAIGEIIVGAAPGVLLWIAAWIVQGFASHPD